MPAYRTLIATTAALALVPTAASAATEHVDETLGQLGLGTVALKGPSPQSTVDLALPARYATAGGKLVLAYEGSPLLARSSTLEVSVGGVPATAAHVGPGRHRITVPLDRARVNGADQQIQLQGRLRLKGQVCPPPDAPGAYLRISKSSRLTLDATLASGALTLDRLPSVLDQKLGASAPPVAVEFHAAPSAGAVQAAALAVGQVDRATGFPGVRVNVGLPGASVAPARGGLRIMLTERPGAAATAVALRHDGGVDIRLAGSAASLLSAASALTSPVAAKLTGDRATVPTLALRDEDRAIPKALPVGAAEADGLGAVAASATFRVPEWLELDRGARLQARIGWSAPFGGQLRTLVNGIADNERRLGSTGATQYGLNQLLAGAGPQAVRGEVQTGDNTLTAAGDLGAGAAGTCLPLDAQGSTGVLPGGSLRIRAHARPADATLATWPFPLSAKRDGRGGTLVLPASPTAAELSAGLETLAEVARWSNEASETAVAIAPAQLPTGHLLLLARPGAVPANIAGALHRAAPAGTLASIRQDGRLVTLAVGPQALAPLRHGVYPGIVKGSVAWISPTGAIHVLAGENPLATAAVRDDGTPWQWPLAVIILGGALLIARGLWGAHRGMKQRTAAAGPPAGSVERPAPDASVSERLATWHRRHGEDASA